MSRNRKIAWVVGALVLVLCAGVAAIHFNRGGTGTLERGSLSSPEKCTFTKDSARAVIRFRGAADGSISVGATLQVVDDTTGDELGSKTKRFTVSDPVRLSIPITVHYDADADAKPSCWVSSPRSGWHFPGH